MDPNVPYLGKTLPDEKIIELYWERNEQAIRETDLKYGRYLLSVAYNILHDSRDCEECQNDTYLGTWNAIPPNRPGFFQAFLTKILRRVSINLYKQKHREKRIPSELTVSLEEFGDTLRDDSSADESIDASEVGRIISDFLRNQSEKRRLIFVFRYYYADSVENIAGMLGITPRTVYNDLTALREGLKQRLEEEGYEL